MGRALQGHPRLSGAIDGRPERACPLVLRGEGDQRELLAFTHPLAGRQFVKGRIQPAELPEQAAIRELAEESGVQALTPVTHLGACPIGPYGLIWHFVDCPTGALPDRWQHWTADDGGHLFDFFWHPLRAPLDGNWDRLFHDAHAVIRRLTGA